MTDGTLGAPSTSTNTATDLWRKLSALVQAHRKDNQPRGVACQSLSSGNLAASSPVAAAAPDAQQAPTHLVVMANGLFGRPGNWTTILAKLRERVDGQVLLHASQVNTKTDTYDGIDVCGWRLAQEMEEVVRQNPTLERISVMGHSMGGLLLRYAIGVSYNPATGKIAGLEPCHFITLATPHLGCDWEGESQVPFIGWLGALGPLQKVLHAVSVPTSAALFRRTGRQFFLADDDAWSQPGVAGLPLLARMAHDVPERREYFWSALCSFASRTAYANTGMDHLVGWANSSLRFMHQLPRLPPEAARAKGVVLQDDLLSAFDVRFKPQVEPQSAISSMDLPISGPSNSGQEGQDGSGEPAADGGSGSELINDQSTTANGVTSSGKTASNDAAAGSSSGQQDIAVTAHAHAAASPFAAAAGAAAGGVPQQHQQQHQQQGAMSYGAAGQPGQQQLRSPTGASSGGANDDRQPLQASGSGIASGSLPTAGAQPPLQAARANSTAKGNTASRNASGSEMAEGEQQSAATRRGSGNVPLSGKASSSKLSEGRAQMVETMLQRLQSLAWRRVDVSWKGSVLPFAHNHIQVTRPWLNFEGEGVAIHVAEQFVQLERTYQSLRSKPDTLAHLARQSSFEQPQRPQAAMPYASKQAVEEDAHAQDGAQGVHAGAGAPQPSKGAGAEGSSGPGEIPVTAASGVSMESVEEAGRGSAAADAGRVPSSSGSL